MRSLGAIQALHWVCCHYISPAVQALEAHANTLFPTVQVGCVWGLNSASLCHPISEDPGFLHALWLALLTILDGQGISTMVLTSFAKSMPVCWVAPVRLYV